MRHSYLLVPFAFVAVVASGGFEAQAQTNDPVIRAGFEAGTVGEQSDGFLGVVTGQTAEPELQRRLAERNTLRREEYDRLAEVEGQPASIIAQLTAEKLINRLPTGLYYRDNFGSWKQK
jgi:uncharacterized protein YdbL (DUF1318 family)